MNTYLYAWLIFGMVTVLFLMGYEPLIFSSTTTYSTLDYQVTFFDLVITYLQSWEALLTTAIIAVTVLISGFNLIVLIPFILLSATLNLLVFPVSSINTGGLPVEVALIIGMFFNLATFLVIMSFLRTGE